MSYIFTYTYLGKHTHTKSGVSSNVPSAVVHNSRAVEAPNRAKGVSMPTGRCPWFAFIFHPYPITYTISEQMCTCTLFKAYNLWPTRKSWHFNKHVVESKVAKLVFRYFSPE